jgi:tetratricopeptide (TPR) repeat protein
MAAERDLSLQTYLAREPVFLAALTVLAVVLFVAVTGLSRLYHAQQESLGDRWFRRGVADLDAKRYDRAVIEYRAALVYSRDNYSYQLNLAEALIGNKKIPEAYAYLINLWDREPENGLVNLALARIAAQRGQTEQALRYYHNAIYSIWPNNQEEEQRDARLELIEFLLGINAKAQAQSELIALAANLGDGASEQSNLGDLFMRAQDYEHALAAYRLSLKSDRHNLRALAGAGRAAFELANYPLAYSYLQAAVSADPGDTQSTNLLQTTEMVLQMDPYQRSISAAQRARIVMTAFDTAGERLKACGDLNSFGLVAGSAPNLAGSWATIKPQITEARLRRDPDLVESAMELVFNIERQTSTTCGTPAGKDEALLLIAKLHERS